MSVEEPAELHAAGAPSSAARTSSQQALQYQHRRVVMTGEFRLQCADGARPRACTNACGEIFPRQLAGVRTTFRRQCPWHQLFFLQRTRRTQAKALPTHARSVELARNLSIHLCCRCKLVRHCRRCELPASPSLLAPDMSPSKVCNTGARRTAPPKLRKATASATIVRQVRRPCGPHAVVGVRGADFA